MTNLRSHISAEPAADSSLRAPEWRLPNVPSWHFLLLVLLGAVVFNTGSARRWRDAVWLVLNLSFVWSFECRRGPGPDRLRYPRPQFAPHFRARLAAPASGPVGRAVAAAGP